MASLDIAEKRPEAARARADALLEKMPKSAPALVFAARIHGGTGDWTRAEGLLKTAIETDPASLEAYGLLGQLYTSQNRLDAARETFEEVVKRRPEDVSAHTLVALIDEMQGNTAAARQRYEHIVRIDPNAAVACNNLAYIYAEHGGNLDVALQLAQRARQKLPDAPQIADTLGWVYYRKGLAQLAVPMFQRGGGEGCRRAPRTTITWRWRTRRWETRRRRARRSLRSLRPIRSRRKPARLGRRLRRCDRLAHLRGQGMTPMGVKLAHASGPAEPAFRTQTWMVYAPGAAGVQENVFEALHDLPRDHVEPLNTQNWYV